MYIVEPFEVETFRDSVASLKKLVDCFFFHYTKNALAHKISQISSQTVIFTDVFSPKSCLLYGVLYVQYVASVYYRVPIPCPQYLALQILENLIKTRWKALPQDQREGMGAMHFIDQSNRSIQMNYIEEL